jgi:hypothetical protein
VTKEDKKFYVKITSDENGESYSISLNEPAGHTATEPEVPTSRSQSRQISSASSFGAILNDFVNVMDMYVKFIPLVLSAGPIILSNTATRRIKKLASVYGRKRDDISNDSCVVYELDRAYARKIHEYTLELRAESGVAKYMRKLGRDGGINAEDYRTWPVFRGLRGKPEIAAAFKEVFGEDLVNRGFDRGSTGST